MKIDLASASALKAVIENDLEVNYPFDVPKLRDLRFCWITQGPQVVAALRAFANALPTDT